MKLENTNKKRSKRVTLLIGAGVILYFALYFSALFYVITQGSEYSEGVFVLVLIGLVSLVMIIGVVLVVRQRLKEINKGEIDEARKY